jgi:hypothetical protein
MIDLYLNDKYCDYKAIPLGRKILRNLSDLATARARETVQDEQIPVTTKTV